MTEFIRIGKTNTDGATSYKLNTLFHQVLLCCSYMGLSFLLQ
jgi:hypothetical protein